MWNQGCAFDPDTCGFLFWILATTKAPVFHKPVDVKILQNRSSFVRRRRRSGMRGAAGSLFGPCPDPCFELMSAPDSWVTAQSETPPVIDRRRSEFERDPVGVTRLRRLSRLRRSCRHIARSCPQTWKPVWRLAGHRPSCRPMCDADRAECRALPSPSH